MLYTLDPSTLQAIKLFSIASWLLLSFATAQLASRYGRGGFMFFIIALLISPFIAACFLLAMGKDKEFIEERLISELKTAKRCQSCYEIVSVKAIKCKHCGSLVQESNDI